MRISRWLQLSVDGTKPAAWHFEEVGRKLATLRDGRDAGGQREMWFITCGLCVGTVTIYHVSHGRRHLAALLKPI